MKNYSEKSKNREAGQILLAVALFLYFGGTVASNFTHHRLAPIEAAADAAHMVSVVIASFSLIYFLTK